MPCYLTWRWYLAGIAEQNSVHGLPLFDLLAPDRFLFDLVSTFRWIDLEARSFARDFSLKMLFTRGWLLEFLPTAVTVNQQVTFIDVLSVTRCQSGAS
jgi:hypothetical protein